jgi:hypothetical protein
VTGSVPARAAGVDGTEPLGRVPFDGVVKSVTYLARADISGANTDTRTVSIINKGADGLGATSVASLAMTSGVDSVASKEKALTLSGTAANLNVTEGDVLAFLSAHSGSTGLADPGGVVMVKIARRPTAE